MVRTGQYLSDDNKEKKPKSSKKRSPSKSKTPQKKIPIEGYSDVTSDAVSAGQESSQVDMPSSGEEEITAEQLTILQSKIRKESRFRTMTKEERQKTTLIDSNSHNLIRVG